MAITPKTRTYKKTLQSGRLLFFTLFEPDYYTWMRTFSFIAYDLLHFSQLNIHNTF